MTGVAWLQEPVELPRYVVWTALLTSPALWARWAKQQLAKRFGGN